MKKLLGYLFMAVAFLITGAAISSCIINESENYGLPGPSVGLAADGTTYNISFAPVTGMKYANIIRLYTSDSTFKTGVEEQNIGQVIPDNLNNIASSFMFTDSFTATGTFYKYKIRYWNGSYYSYSEISENVLEGKTSGEAAIPDASLNCVWNDKDKIYTLVLATDVDPLPAGFTELSFLVSNSTNKKPFSLAFVDDGTTTVSAANAKTIDLQKALSTEFLNTKIEVFGVIAIMSESDNKGEKISYTRYYWTNKAGVTLTINYTDSTGSTADPKDANSPLFVPSANNPVNEFDFNANLLNLSVN